MNAGISRVVIHQVLVSQGPKSQANRPNGGWRGYEVAQRRQHVATATPLPRPFEIKQLSDRLATPSIDVKAATEHRARERLRLSPFIANPEAMLAAKDQLASLIEAELAAYYGAV